MLNGKGWMFKVLLGKWLREVLKWRKYEL